MVSTSLGGGKILSVSGVMWSLRRWRCNHHGLHLLILLRIIRCMNSNLEFEEASNE